MNFHDTMETIVRAFEVLGVAILALGTILAFVNAGRTALRRDGSDVGRELRRDIGRAILLGLEVLIVADVIQTVTVDPTLENALVLGIIVLIRSFLSASIEVEVYGALPWRRRSAEDATMAESGHADRNRGQHPTRGSRTGDASCADVD